MAFINRPPIQTGSRVSNETSTWSRLGRRVPFPPLIIRQDADPTLIPGIGQPAVSGVQILDSGQYEIDFDFTVTGLNAGIKIRVNANNAGGPQPPLEFTIDGSGSFKRFLNVTDEQLGSGNVILYIESASINGQNEHIIWKHAELSIKQLTANKNQQ